MDLALEQARLAEAAGEVPVGAIVVHQDGSILGKGFNKPVSSHDPTAHAEIVALREAATHVANYRLSGASLYCTLEPCPMCAGAMVHARIGRLVFGTTDPRAGAAGTLYDIVNDARLNHQVEVHSGIRQQECRSLLQAFFASRRTNDPR
jgi:tRNA(adenine34) deaminase